MSIEEALVCEGHLSEGVHNLSEHLTKWIKAYDISFGFFCIEDLKEYE